MNWLKRYYKELKIELNKRLSIYWDQSTVHEPTTLFVISIILSLASAYIASTMKPKIPSAPEREGIKTNTRSTEEPLRIVYGTQRVGGNDVYGTTLGSKNKYLYLIQTLSEGECDSIDTDEGTPQVFVDDKIYTSFGSDVSYSFHNGSSSQTVDSVLNSADSQWTDPLQNTSYIRWRFRWNEDKFRGVPKRQLNLKGLKVYDFRDTTTAWSDNAVLCLYDYFTNSRYGLDIESSKIDTTSWTTAANYIDSKGWGCNLVISLNDRNAWSVVEDILALFRGTISWFDGKYYLKLADLNEESSQMTIEDENIAQDTSGKAMITIVQPSRFEKPDGMRVTFIDKEKQYTSDDIVIGESTGLVEQMDLNGCTDREMASNLATSQLERAKLDRTISGTFSDDCILLEPHDIVTFNSDALAISDQTMRVLSTNVQESGLVNLTFGYESYDLYDDDYDTTIEGVYTVDLPDPNDVVLIENPTIEEEKYVERTRSFTRLNIDFEVPDDEPWFKDVEVWTSTISGGNSYRHQYNTTNNFSIDKVEEGQQYWVKLRTVNIWGVKQELDSATTLYKNILGAASDIPESLTSLVAIPGDGSVRLVADKLDDPDIEVYEFRLGSQWTGGVFLTAKRSPHEIISGIKPGNHTFSVNSKGTNGLYGDYPQTATVNIEKPKGWADYTTFTDDYATSAGFGPSGGFLNTEWTSAGGGDWLIGQHSSAYTPPLSGSYLSEEFDTGVAAEKYYVYLDAGTTVTGLGSTWNDILSGGTWDDINASTRTWREIFEINEAPNVNMEIWNKAEVGHNWSKIEKAEVSSGVVTARYYKVNINIIDPSDQVYAKIEDFTLHLLN